MIKKILDLSTAHISTQTNAILTSISLGEDPEGKEKLPFRFCAHDYGYVIFVGDADSLLDEHWTTVPELRPIVAKAIAEDCTLINFDRDAETYDCFKEFEW